MARPEVTGRRQGGRVDPFAPPRLGLTIVEFCRRWNISISTFYSWRKAGVAPKVTQPAGKYGRAFITLEAEAAWARQHAQAAELVA